jgi:hypothetical protein
MLLSYARDLLIKKHAKPDFVPPAKDFAAD